MHPILSLLLADLFISLLVALSQAIPAPTSVDFAANRGIRYGNTETKTEFIESEGGQDDDDAEDSDFEDNDLGAIINLTDSHTPDGNSITHLHQEQGEVLLPCFGMWWPVGGGPVYYDYGVDYYGDYKRKKRRSRRQKKAAKMKRKKI